MAPTICTIISKDHLSFARTLVDSFLQYHPDGTMFALLTDKNAGHIDPAQEKFSLIEVSEIDIPDIGSLYDKYNVAELNTAMKPFFLEYLLTRYHLDKVLYLDSDILILNKLNKLYRYLDHHSIVITPHTLVPIPDDDRHTSELDLLKTGAYNLGFIGLSNVNETHRFLQWWQSRLHKYCFMRTHEGLFGDQKWIDLVPSLFGGTYIIRDESYNVAYWNLHERNITCRNGQFYANDKPIVFYHFSGILTDDLERISRHQNRYRLSEFPGLHALFATYQRQLEKNGYQQTKAWEYSRPF